MKLPQIDLKAHQKTVEFTDWKGRRIDVGRLYHALTAKGWKIDTEESNLMQSMSKTWRSAGIKVWLTLEQSVSAPPDEDEALDKIVFYRFDPKTMPTGTMREQMYEPGYEDEDWVAEHQEEWAWLIEHGDPQTETFELLTPIAFSEVPPKLLREAWTELSQALVLAPA